MKNSPKIHIDFLSPKMTYRRKHLSLKKEMLAKALGLNKKREKPPLIIDATAGLGQDSFILACLGFEVTLLERSPVIYAALEDAMARAKQNTLISPIIKRMKLLKKDSIKYLTSLKMQEFPEIIYLDPMFPERQKSALNKLEMRLLHEAVGQDPDADRLFQTALSCANERVVVKRPRLANPLGNIQPSYSLEGRSNRFDVYITLGTQKGK